MTTSAQKTPTSCRPQLCEPFPQPNTIPAGWDLSEITRRYAPDSMPVDEKANEQTIR